MYVAFVPNYDDFSTRPTTSLQQFLEDVLSCLEDKYGRQLTVLDLKPMVVQTMLLSPDDVNATRDLVLLSPYEETDGMEILSWRHNPGTML